MGFFHTPKPGKFRVEPRYWDPEKEKREARERRIKTEMGIADEDGTYRPYISRGDFKKGLSGGLWAERAKAKSRRRTRLLVIIVLLALLVFFMMQ